MDTRPAVETVDEVRRLGERQIVQTQPLHLERTPDAAVRALPRLRGHAADGAAHLGVSLKVPAVVHGEDQAHLVAGLVRRCAGSFIVHSRSFYPYPTDRPT